MMTRRKQRRGSYATEFFFTLPVFVGFVMGIVDYGWFFNQHMAVTMVARDAARATSLEPLPTAGGSDDPANAVGVPQCTVSLQAAGLPTSGTPCACNLVGIGAPDQAVTCTVTVPFTPLLGLIPTPANLTAETTMRMEEQPLATN